MANQDAFRLVRMGKKIIMSVISDLVTDERVHRSALALHSAGYDLTLVGREKRTSLTLQPRPYKSIRFKLWFETGPLFYANYNICLFFYLLFHKSNYLHANDLDTLLPNYLISKWRKIPLVYDSHEYFTGVPELLERPKVRNTWKNLENWLVPKVDLMFSVNKSLSQKYGNEYQREVFVLRNIPFSIDWSKVEPIQKTWDPNLKVIIYQGAINKDRGVEEAILAMQYISNAILIIIGDGDVFDEVKALADILQLQAKVKFTGKLRRDELVRYTRLADLGLCIEKPTNENYIFSLPNKLFDYINAEVPILASHLIEIENIINENQIGGFIENHDPRHIAERINLFFDPNNENYSTWKQNLKTINGKYTWENESKKLLNKYEDFKS